MLSTHASITTRGHGRRDRASSIRHPCLRTRDRRTRHRAPRPRAARRRRAAHGGRPRRGHGRVALHVLASPRNLASPGTSPRPAECASVAALADLYAGLLERRGLSDVLVVGSSMGGWIGAEIALRACLVACADSCWSMRSASSSTASRWLTYFSLDAAWPRLNRAGGRPSTASPSTPPRSRRNCATRWPRTSAASPSTAARTWATRR